jgi:hypothetical protein
MPVIDTIKNIIRRKFETELELIISDLRDELRQQGHRATGSLEDSLTFEIKDSDKDGLLGTIFGNDYWRPLDTGVAASRIPYSPGKGRGGTSKYIQALIEWAAVVRPELDERERKGFVFAVATKASREGNPTKGSYSFSRNGARTGFVERTINKHIDSLAASIGGQDLSDKIAAEILRAA